MITQNQITEIGKFNHPHGINGEISAVIDDCVDVEALKCIVVEFDGILIPFFINSVRSKSSTTVLLGIDDVENEIQASKFSNKIIYALADDSAIAEDIDSSDEDGLYASDLIGYKIESVDGVLNGEIVDIDDSTANVLFIVLTADNRQILVPVADELIDSIDERGRKILVDLPQGLLDIM